MEVIGCSVGDPASVRLDYGDWDLIGMEMILPTKSKLNFSP
jgi:hypothetical protein